MPWLILIALYGASERDPVAFYRPTVEFPDNASCRRQCAITLAGRAGYCACYQRLTVTLPAR